MNAKEIFEKLVAKAAGYSFFLSSKIRRGVNQGKPGELVEKLSSEEREELKNLSSKDVKDADRNTLLYMTGMYPEQTVTVHTHTLKKDSDES